MKYKFKAKSLKTGEELIGDLVYITDNRTKKTPKRPAIVSLGCNGGFVYCYSKTFVDEDTIELIDDSSSIQKEFPVTSVTREDLLDIGFDGSKADDSTMKKLAQKLSDDYCEQLFWTSLEVIAEACKIPKL